MKRSALRPAAILTALLPMAALAIGATPQTAPSKGRTLADLAWMAGSWAGRDGSTEMEEHWTAPKGGSMLSLHRDVKDGRMVSFEFARIEEGPDGIVFLASPRGRGATPFKLKSLEGHRAVFENPEHDFPQRVIYWLEADGSLAARVEGTQKGREDSMEWRWRPSSLK